MEKLSPLVDRIESKFLLLAPFKTLAARFGQSA